MTEIGNPASQKVYYNKLRKKNCKCKTNKKETNYMQELLERMNDLNTRMTNYDIYDLYVRGKISYAEMDYILTFKYIL